MAKSKKYAVRDAWGNLLQKRFTNKADARRWQEAEQRKRQAIRAGISAPAPDLKQVTFEEYAKLYLCRREEGKVLDAHFSVPGVHKKRRKPVVKGTFVRDEQLIRDYALPLVGHRILASITPQEWEQVFEHARKNPKWLEREKEWERKRLEKERLRLQNLRARKAVSSEAAKARKPRITELSPRTINLLRAAISRLYEDAIVEGAAVSNPIMRTLPREDRPLIAKTKFWKTAEECARYLAEAKKEGPMFYCWAVWQLNQGPRVNETTAIQHKDVDTRSGTIDIYKIVDIKDGFRVRERTKGKKSRTIAMTQSMVEAYLEHLKSTPFNHPEDFVFTRPGGKDPRPASAYWLYRTHLKVCDRAGVERINVHQMRHTFAAQYLMAGGNIRYLQELLGHANINTTQRYGGLAKKDLLEKARLFEVSAPKPEQLDNVRKLKK